MNIEMVRLPQYSWLKINELLLWVQAFHLLQLYISGAINFTTLGFCLPALPMEFCYDRYALIKTLKCHWCCILQLKYKNTFEVHNTSNIHLGKYKIAEAASKMRISVRFENAAWRSFYNLALKDGAYKVYQGETK